MLRLRRRYFNVARQFDTLSKRLDLMGVVTCSQGSQEDPLIALSCGKKASSFVKDNWIPPCIDPQSKATLMLVDNQSANMNGNEKKRVSTSMLLAVSTRRICDSQLDSPCQNGIAMMWGAQGSWLCRGRPKTLNPFKWCFHTLSWKLFFIMFPSAGFPPWPKNSYCVFSVGCQLTTTRFTYVFEKITDQSWNDAIKCARHTVSFRGPTWNLIIALSLQRDGSRAMAHVGNTQNKT